MQKEAPISLKANARKKTCAAQSLRAALRRPTSLYTREALAGSTNYNFANQGTIPSGTQEYSDYCPAGARIVCGHWPQKSPEKNRGVSRSFLREMFGFAYSPVAKKATATAPGPAWVPTTLPTMEMGSLSTLPSHSAALSVMYFCSSASLRPV